MVGRRHGSEEIADKLAQADQLAAKGKNQHEISKALGISVMTYHRWRKQRGPMRSTRDDDDHRQPLLAPVVDDEPHYTPPVGGRSRRLDRMEELEQENTRLRRLVTDLLLEKVGLEEELKLRDTGRDPRARRG